MPKIIENLKSRLLQEAEKQIRVSGYGALTMRSIAAACDVSVGTVYNYFPSKENLLVSLLSQDWFDCLAAVQKASEEEACHAIVARCICEQICLFIQKNEYIFRDEATGLAYAASLTRYRSSLRQQLASPMRKFCDSDFTAEFIAEALIVWTLSGKDFEEIYRLVGKLI